MEDLWFEEQLVLSQNIIQELAKSLSKDGAHISVTEVDDSMHVIVRYEKPRWGELDPDKSNLQPAYMKSRFILVRFGFDFSLSRQAWDNGLRLSSARCIAYLGPVAEDQPKPRVFHMLPSNLNRGSSDPYKAQVKVGPEIELEAVDASAGEARTDFTIGYVQPIWRLSPGYHDDEPEWELRPGSGSLLGRRHFWAVVEIPLGCIGLEVAVGADGFLATPILSRNRKASSRPREVIGVLA
jgi:hypothetical protein